MDLLDPKIDDFLKSSDSLLDENDLEDEDQQRVERESELIKKRWNKVKNDAKSREPRFVYTITEFHSFIHGCFPRSEL